MGGLAETPFFSEGGGRNMYVCTLPGLTRILVYCMGSKGGWTKQCSLEFVDLLTRAGTWISSGQKNNKCSGFKGSFRCGIQQYGCSRGVEQFKRPKEEFK